MAHMNTSQPYSVSDEEALQIMFTIATVLFQDDYFPSSAVRNSPDTIECNLYVLAFLSAEHGQAQPQSATGALREEYNVYRVIRYGGTGEYLLVFWKERESIPLSRQNRKSSFHSNCNIYSIRTCV